MSLQHPGFRLRAVGFSVLGILAGEAFYYVFEYQIVCDSGRILVPLVIIAIIAITGVLDAMI